MKSQKKLIVAHLFALVSLVLILAVANLFKLNISLSGGVTFLHVLLVVIPQLGFGYLFWNNVKTEKKVLSWFFDKMFQHDLRHAGLFIFLLIFLSITKHLFFLIHFINFLNSNLCYNLKDLIIPKLIRSWCWIWFPLRFWDNGVCQTKLTVQSLKFRSAPAWAKTTSPPVKACTSPFQVSLAECSKYPPRLGTRIQSLSNVNWWKPIADPLKILPNW